MSRGADAHLMETTFTVMVSGEPASDRWTGPAERVALAALALLAQRGVAPIRGELSVLLVDDTEIQHYNQLYRGKDVPTDVLSFAQLEGDGPDLTTLPAEFPLPIGDIVISIPRMREQAAEFGHSENREFAFLLVHGILHLLGFDHENEDDASLMLSTAEDVLASIGLSRDAVDA